jgi:glycosyltransferase involved in cell wall biosynthesis
MPLKFALTVGTLEPRKNFGFLSKNWDEVWIQTDLPLIIVGGDGWNIPQLKNSFPSVYQIGKVCNASLNQLYEMASLYVAPSKSEGFDIPFHEALLYKIPVIASDIQVHQKFGVPLFTFDDSEDFVSIAINMIVNQIPATIFKENTSVQNYNEFWKDVINSLPLET